MREDKPIHFQELDQILFNAHLRRPADLGRWLRQYFRESAEDRLLARRWGLAIPSFYSTIIVIMTVAAVLASSTASKVTVSAKSERKDILHDRSGPRLLYGSLPNMVDVDLACTGPCMGLRANGVGPAK